MHNTSHPTAQADLACSDKKIGVTDYSTKAAWQNAIAADKRIGGNRKSGPSTDWRIAIILSNRLNMKTGQCNPLSETRAPLATKAFMKRAPASA